MLEAHSAIRVLLADDHPIVRRGLRAVLASDPGIEVVAEAENGEQAVEAAARHKPDVILMDLVMPEMAGVEAIRAIRDHDPASRVLVITGQEQREENVREALSVGALGVLLKDSDPSEIVLSIRRALGRDRETPRKAGPPPEGNDEVRALIEKLSSREIDILRLLALGRTNRQIGAELGLREGTVRSHVSNVLAKLKLKNRTSAALLAIRAGLAHVGTPQ